MLIDVFWFVARCIGFVILLISCVFACTFIGGIAGWMWLMRPRRPGNLGREWYCTASGWTKEEILHRGHCIHDGPCPMDLRQV